MRKLNLNKQHKEMVQRLEGNVTVRILVKEFNGNKNVMLVPFEKTTKIELDSELVETFTNEQENEFKEYMEALKRKYEFTSTLFKETI